MDSPKAFLIADIHIGCHQIELDKWLGVTKSYFEDFFFPLLRREYQEGDIVYILGDFFDNRSHLGLKVMSYAYDIFDKLERMKIKVIAILGNHDLLNEKSYEYHSMKILRHYPNVEVFTEPTIYNHGSKQILLMPWITEKKEEQAVLRKFAGQTHYLFCHSDLSGAKTNMKTTMTHGLTIAEFVSYPKVYSGHIHIRQRIDNFLFVGAPYHMDRNDKGNKKGVYVLDIESGAETFYENTVSPQFKTIEIKTEEDIDKLEMFDETSNPEKKDWYDLVISSTVLLKSKTLSTKLRDVTKKTKILSVKHIDDLLIGSKDTNVEIDTLGTDLSVDNFIRDYITTQCEATDMVLREKVMTELEDSIRIFLSSK